MSADVMVCADILFGDRQAAKRFVGHVGDSTVEGANSVQLGGVNLMNVCVMLSWDIVTLRGNCVDVPDERAVLAMCSDIAESSGGSPGRIDIEYDNEAEDAFGSFRVTSGGTSRVELPAAVTARVSAECDDPDTRLARLRVALSGYRACL